jgi:Y_Y_Y domain
MLDPSRLPQPASPAAAGVESVTVDRQAFAAVDNLEIGAHSHELQIDYTSPTLSVPQQVNFRYHLDGYDDGWHEAGPRRQAFYTDVPPGSTPSGWWRPTATAAGTSAPPP